MKKSKQKKNIKYLKKIIKQNKEILSYLRPKTIKKEHQVFEVVYVDEEI